MPTSQSFSVNKLNQRGVIHFLLPLILVLGLIAGVYLVTSGNPLKLFSKASMSKTVPPETSLSLVGPEGCNLGWLCFIKPDPEPGKANRLIQVDEDVKIEKKAKNQIEVKLMARSDLEKANLFTAKMTFPKDLVEVSGIKTDGSFVTNWVENYYDNDKGEISLTGGVPSPGLQTQQGGESILMATIVFSTKSKEKGVISFTDSSAIYSNLNNINILTTKRGYEINANANAKSPSISLPTSASTGYDMKVLVLKYFPLTPDGKNINIKVTGDVGGSYSVVRQVTTDVTNNLKLSLEKATRYLGYKDSTAPSALRYQIIDTKEYTEAVPFNSPDRRPLYNQILTDNNICDYVNQGVQEVWMWAYQGPTYPGGKMPYLNISESKMSGPFGNISNSYRENDMPNCGKTYRLYVFNYGRGTAEALESWGHQLEAELDAVDRSIFRDIWQGSNYPPKLDVSGRCGSVHNPPNSMGEYNRNNSTPWKSDCMDWNPDGIGTLSDISCRNWGCEDINPLSDNTSLNYMIWNWQNLPGLGNKKSYQGKRFRSWWDVHGDFDNVMKKPTLFTSSTSTTPPPPCSHAAPPEGCSYEGPDIFPECNAKLVCPSSTPTPLPVTKGDGNKDGKINLIDMSVLHTDYQKDELKGQIIRNGIDMNNDKMINVNDFAILRQLLQNLKVIRVSGG